MDQASMHRIADTASESSSTDPITPQQIPGVVLYGHIELGGSVGYPCQTGQ